MSPSDAAIWPCRPLGLPARSCPALRARTPNRASQAPAGSFGARCLLRLRGVGLGLRIDSFPTDAGFALLGRLATPTLCNEAVPGSRDPSACDLLIALQAGAQADTTARASAFPNFNGQDRLHPLKGRLHDSRPFVRVNTLQLTRTAKLCLALSECMRMNTRALAVESNRGTL